MMINVSSKWGTIRVIVLNAAREIIKHVNMLIRSELGYQLPSSAIHLVCVLVLLFFDHGQNHWKLSGQKYLMPVKITVSTTKWTISDTKCCWSAQQLRDLHSGSCANRAHLEDYRRKLSWASLIFSRSPKMTVFWPFLEKTENSRIQMYGTRRYRLVSPRTVKKVSDLKFSADF